MSCAYCGGDKKRTREHIIPGGIISLFPHYDYVFTEDKAYKAESVIRDVCNECNNGPLGDWDNYGVNLIKKHFLKKYPECDHSLTYDYSKLSRWLLKMIYNAARAGKWADHGADLDYMSWFANNKEFLIDRSETKKSKLRFTLSMALYKSPPFNLSPIGLTIQPALLFDVDNGEDKLMGLPENYGGLRPVLIWFGSAMFLVFLWKEDAEVEQIETALVLFEALFPYSILKEDRDFIEVTCGVDIVNGNLFDRIHSSTLMFMFNNWMIKPRPNEPEEGDLELGDDEDLDLPF